MHPPFYAEYILYLPNNGKYPKYQSISCSFAIWDRLGQAGTANPHKVSQPLTLAGVDPLDSGTLGTG